MWKHNRRDYLEGRRGMAIVEEGWGRQWEGDEATVMTHKWKCHN